jgi:hypothetical protein
MCLPSLNKVKSKVKSEHHNSTTTTNCGRTQKHVTTPTKIAATPTKLFWTATFEILANTLVIMQTLNWTNQYPLFMTVRHIFEISEDDHPSFVSHARDH